MVRKCLEVELATLPSRNEVFWGLPPSLPHGRYVAGKAGRLLGWETMHPLTSYFTRARL